MKKLLLLTGLVLGTAFFTLEAAYDNEAALKRMFAQVAENEARAAALPALKKALEKVQPLFDDDREDILIDAVTADGIATFKKVLTTAAAARDNSDKTDLATINQLTKQLKLIKIVGDIAPLIELLPLEDAQAADPSVPTQAAAKAALEAAVICCNNAPAGQTPEATTKAINDAMKNLSNVLNAAGKLRLAQTLAKLPEKQRLEVLASFKAANVFSARKQAEAAEYLIKAQEAQTREEKRSFLDKHKKAIIAATAVTAVLATAIMYGDFTSVTAYGSQMAQGASDLIAGNISSGLHTVASGASGAASGIASGIGSGFANAASAATTGITNAAQTAWSYVPSFSADIPCSANPTADAASAAARIAHQNLQAAEVAQKAATAAFNEAKAAVPTSWWGKFLNDTQVLANNVAAARKTMISSFRAVESAREALLVTTQAATAATSAAAAQAAEAAELAAAQSGLAIVGVTGIAAKALQRVNRSVRSKFARD